MTFGWDGEQIPELQGAYTAELAAAVRANAGPETEFIGWPPDEPAVWLGGV